MDVKPQAAIKDLKVDDPPPKSHDDVLVDARYFGSVKKKEEDKANPKPDKQCSWFE